MPLLSRFLTGGYKYADNGAGTMSGIASKEEEGMEPRLIDYELLVDGSGKRTVAFGWFAGGQRPDFSYTHYLSSQKN